MLLPPQTAVVKEVLRSRSELDLPPLVLTVQDLAVLLATSSSAVYSRVARGQISGAFRIGRSLHGPVICASTCSQCWASGDSHLRHKSLQTASRYIDRRGAGSRALNALERWSADGGALELASK